MNPRRATAADATAIAEVHVASWQVAYRGFFPDAVLDGLNVSDRVALWAPRLADPATTIWVAEHERKVTGFIYACPSRDADAPPPDFAEVAALYVHPKAWGSGCGRALCHTAFDHLRHMTDAQAVTVWVLTANARARKFYERVGFKPDDSRKDITLFNITLPELRYRQNLR